MTGTGPSNDRRVPRRVLLRGVGGATTLALAGCVGGGSDGDGDGGSDGDNSGDGDGSGGRLQLAQAKSPIEFDPVVLNDVPSAEVADQIFEAPYQFSQDLELVPELASGQPEIERGGQRWIVPLNGDATFQNGDPVTASDVAYSYTAPLEEETENAGEVNMIETVEPVDETAVQYDLRFEFGAFKWYLSRSVVPESVREADKDAFNKEAPVGSGPFTFGDWNEGEFVELSRWDDYWGEPVPDLSTVEFTPVEEGTTRITTLETGENDVVKGIPPQSWQTIENMSNASVEAVEGVGYFYLAFNCNEGATADPQVREAVDYAFSMDDAVEQFVEPTGVRQYAPVPSVLSEQWDFPVEEWADIPRERDVDRAKSLLDDAEAVPDDWTAEIIVPPDNKRENIGVSVGNGIEAAGYSANVTRLDWSQFLEQYNTGSADDYNMYTLGWAGSPDPDTFMYFLFAQEQEGVTNGTFYRNDQVDRDITQARLATDREERRSRYVDAITTILEQRVHIPSYNLRNSFGVRDRVRDFAAHPTAQFRLVAEGSSVSVE